MNGTGNNFHGPAAGSGRPPHYEKRSDINFKADKDNFESLQVRSETIKKWIVTGIDKSAIDFSNYFGEFFARNGLTTSQIRIVFGELRRIQMNGYSKEKTSFLLLKPKLAYAVKRNKSNGLTKFYDFFSIAYDAVETLDDHLGEVHFLNFINLFESVLAYHKFHGGQ